ncbi:hypothetical protein ACVWXM_008680 [Bradyrhizobium sp. GM7.3]
MKSPSSRTELGLFFVRRLWPAGCAQQCPYSVQCWRAGGYFDGEEILACEQAGVAVTLPKPMSSNAKAEGRFGKQDFAYLPDEDVYRCPSGQLLPYH